MAEAARAESVGEGGGPEADAESDRHSGGALGVDDYATCRDGYSGLSARELLLKQRFGF